MFLLPKLQYDYNALEPFFDAKTMEIHHTKHHQTYVDKLNEIVKGDSSLQNKTLEELCLIPATKNMAGGHYNHSFLWETIGPKGNDFPIESILELKDEFNESAMKLFGSGWVWIVNKDGVNKVVTMPLQDSPLTIGVKPILGIDLWEHAYYLKYQNRRAEYVESFWNVVNWGAVSKKLN